MKKLSIKNLTSIITTLCLVALLSVSCSSSDEEKDPAVVFTSLNTNKTDVFVEEKIILTLEGTGYTDVNVTSNNPAVTISKIAATAYEISSTTNANVYIYATLNNNTNQASKSVTLTFNEHGIKDFNTVEGIKVNVDKSSKVLSLLGEPDLKSDSTSGLAEMWSYASKGLTFFINKSNSTVDQIDMFSPNYFFTKDNVKVNYTNYPYEIGYGWKINSTTTMDLVVAELGAPTVKSTSTTSLTNRAYQYTTQRIAFRFYSDSEDNYIGKKIAYFSVY